MPAQTDLTVAPIDGIPIYARIFFLRSWEDNAFGVQF